jgi:MGT family glycosyltransferase
MMSCNPLEVRDEHLPPVFSGYPVADRSGWQQFRDEYDRTHRPMWTEYDQWVRSCGAPGLPDLDFVATSQHLNLYLYPEVIDYTDQRTLGSTWHRLDSSVRATDAAFEVPESLRDRPGSLIYLSLGSLGSADVELMKRLVDVLGRTPHRFIVSKGPQHDQIQLADNMWGDQQVPQTNVLPLVDLVITHGGNNTTTECFHFGKPMIVLPLFWDQYDNAQRVHETGHGVRLDTYRFTDDEMTAAIERLLGDAHLRSTMAGIATTIQQRSGTVRAADLIERVGV